MREELPPISLLLAFSRAAETLSFKEAAAELNLSASALSRQIQSLEAGSSRRHPGRPSDREPVAVAID
jgi:hypothetical protein